MGHYIENTGDEPLRFLEMFRSSYFADVSLNQWMALPKLVQAHLNLDQQTMAALIKKKPIIVRGAKPRGAVEASCLQVGRAYPAGLPCCHEAAVGCGADSK